MNPDVIRLKSMERGKQVAVEMLTHIGLAVSSIPEATSKRADLSGSDAAGANYLFEVKDKEDIKLTEQQIDRLNAGEVVSDAQPTTYNNTIAGIYDDAARQLEQTPADAGTFRLIWLFADGSDQKLIRDRAFATFYGQISLFSIDPIVKSENGVVECFYFDHNSAFKLQSVDGVILCDSSGIQLLMNEFSMNYSRLKSSVLFEQFAKYDAYVDPTELEESAGMIAFRSAMPRGDDKNTLAEIERQTGVKYQPIRLKRYSSSVITPPQTPNTDADAV